MPFPSEINFSKSRKRQAFPSIQTLKIIQITLFLEFKPADKTPRVHPQLMARVGKCPRHFKSAAIFEKGKAAAPGGHRACSERAGGAPEVRQARAEVAGPGRVPEGRGGLAMVDYSVWDHIEVSDDEDETHPNIDTASLFRWRHQVRLGVSASLLTSPRLSPPTPRAWHSAGCPVPMATRPGISLRE